MAQPFQSLDPGSASRAIADQDAIESLVLTPVLQPGFDGLRGQHMPFAHEAELKICLLYTSPSPRDATLSRMPSSA